MLWRLVGLCFALGVLGAIVTLLAGKEVLAILFRKGDAAYAGVLAWVMVAAAISYIASILGFAVTATRTFHRFTVPYLIVTIVAIIASALLIPRFGLTGAAWASVSVQSCGLYVRRYLLFLAFISEAFMAQHRDQLVDNYADHFAQN